MCRIYVGKHKRARRHACWWNPKRNYVRQSISDINLVQESRHFIHFEKGQLTFLCRRSLTTALQNTSSHPFPGFHPDTLPSLQLLTLRGLRIQGKFRARQKILRCLFAAPKGCLKPNHSNYGINRVINHLSTGARFLPPYDYWHFNVFVELSYMVILWLLWVLSPHFKSFVATESPSGFPPALDLAGGAVLSPAAG